MRIGLGDSVPSDVDDASPSVRAPGAEIIPIAASNNALTACCAEVYRRLKQADNTLKQANDLSKKAIEIAKKSQPNPGDQCGAPPGYIGYWFNVRVIYRVPKCVGSPYQMRFFGIRCTNGQNGTLVETASERCLLYTFNSRRASANFAENLFREAQRLTEGELHVVGVETLYGVNTGNSGFQGENQFPEREPNNPGIINVCEIPEGHCNDNEYL